MYADRRHVKRLEAHLVELPFRFSFGHALASRSMSLNLVVALTLDDGTVGYGEGIARQYVTGETPDGALDRVCEQYAPSVLGRPLPAHDVAEGIRALRDDLHGESAPAGAAWCALESALLDALGKATGRPVTDFLGGAPRTSVRYSGVAPFASDAALAGILVFFRAYGFPAVKLKLGRSIDRDLATVRLARRILGPSVRLRADANCAWTVDETLAMADRLRPYRIESYEQPVPADDVDGLASLTALLPEDVVVDESLCSPDDARRLIAARACSILNVRVSKCGGPLAALEIVALAREAGLTCQLGAQVGESGILTAAGRAVALAATPGFRDHEGADNLFLLRRDLTVENLTVRPGGRGGALAGPGLGVHVRKEALQRQSRRCVIVTADGASVRRTRRASLVGGDQ